MSRSQRRRVLTRAATLWRTRHPHQAISLLTESGFTDDERREFVLTAARLARMNYQRQITRYST